MTEPAAAWCNLAGKWHDTNEAGTTQKAPGDLDISRTLGLGFPQFSEGDSRTRQKNLLVSPSLYRHGGAAAPFCASECVLSFNQMSLHLLSLVHSVSICSVAWSCFP